MFKPESSYDKKTLIDCGHGRLFGKDNAQLPVDNMLMFDRIISINNNEGSYGKGFIHAELDVRPDLWFFDCHFPGDPVMPGCLGLDAMWQLVGFYLAWSGNLGHGRALGAGQIKFKGEVLPTNKIVTYKINIKRVISRSLALGIADAEMLVDGKKIYEAKDLRVGMFTEKMA